LARHGKQGALQQNAATARSRKMQQIAPSEPFWRKRAGQRAIRTRRVAPAQQPICTKPQWVASPRHRAARAAAAPAGVPHAIPTNLLQRRMIMTRDFLVAGTVALVWGGCASSAELERRADLYDQHAHEATAQHAYDLAATNKDKADKLHAQAARERELENQPQPPAPPEPGDYAPIPVSEFR
jgi:hypothetical protein